MRYLVRPVNGTIDAGWVEVVLLGRVSAVDLKEAERQARRFADELSAILAGFAPELRWDVIEDRDRLAALLQPLDWRQTHLAEIRRREEHLDMQTGRQRPSFLTRDAAEAGGEVYLPHGWLPRPESLTGLLRILLTWPATLLWQIQLVPTELLEPEERALEQQIKACERYLSGEAFRGNLGEPPPRHQHRAALMLEALADQWHRLRDAPFQVRATLASSVFGNVGTTISFRLGRDDAEQFARLFDPYFAVRDLTNLPNWTACVKSHVGGQVVTPYTLTTLPAPTGDPVLRESIREASRLRYGRHREEVDREIAGSLEMREGPEMNSNPGRRLFFSS